MPQLKLANVTLEYVLNRPSVAPRGTVILIHGLGAQLIQWPGAIIKALLGIGYQVLRLDNRDAGLSKLEAPPMPMRFSALDLRAWRRGSCLPAPYTLLDMAGDVIALMDALGIDCAHVMGISMGGMIAQEMAIHHPGRLQSLVVIMSTSGARALGHPRRDVMRAFMQPPPGDASQTAAYLLMQWRLLQGRGHPANEEELTLGVQLCVERGHNAQGFLRQTQAILNASDRTEKLRQLRLPTLVLHGDDDPLIDVSGGHAVAHAIRGAQLEIITGWGHDWPKVVRRQVATRLVEFLA